jgi:protein-cysteine N-palmitoyltransferase HHAT
MSPLSFVRELYALDTLDTRFTTSSSTPLKRANATDGNQTSTGTKDGKQAVTDALPPRWQTLEFYIYLVVFLFCVPQMYWAVVSVSQPGSPNYSKFEPLLSNGWLFGWKVDNSDAQYAGFRNNIPYLIILVFVHPLLRRGYERLTLSTPTTANGVVKSASQDQARGEARLQSRLTFDFVSALVYITALNGTSIFKILLILLVNFQIATALPRQYVRPATWIFNIGILFANELAQGYHYSMLSDALAPIFPASAKWGSTLDSYGGLNPRWEVLFNFTVLRMISFNYDYYWSLDRSRSGSPIEVSGDGPPNT